MSIEEIDEVASEWVFKTNGMKWSNNDTAGDNYGSFIAGVKCSQEKLLNEKDFGTEYKNAIEDYLKDKVKKDVKVVIINRPNDNADI